MDQDPRTTGPAMSDQPRTPDQIHDDIEQTRAELGNTVEALAAKTDVKARVHDRVDEVKETLSDKTPDSTHSAVEKLRANPLPLIGGAVVVLAFLIGRRSARP